MAKGLRASTRKRNNAKLRATVFGPAHDARTQRLSAKLQEIVLKPKPTEERMVEVASEKMGESDNAKVDDVVDEMEVDGSSTKPISAGSSHKQRPGRIEKKKAKRKAKSSVVFAQNPHKKKRAASRGQGAKS